MGFFLGESGSRFCRGNAEDEGRGDGCPSGAGETKCELIDAELTIQIHTRPPAASSDQYSTWLTLLATDGKSARCTSGVWPGWGFDDCKSVAPTLYAPGLDATNVASMLLSLHTKIPESVDHTQDRSSSALPPLRCSRSRSNASSCTSSSPLAGASQLCRRKSSCRGGTAIANWTQSTCI